MSKRFYPSLPVILLSALIVFSCNNNNDTTPTTDTSTGDSDTGMSIHVTDSMNVPLQQHAAAVLAAMYNDTAVSGTIQFHADSAGKVTMQLDISIPAKANKNVAVHIHQHGDCGDSGNAAHGHWNPTNANHGKWGSAAYHSGDIGNVKLDATGKGTLAITTDRWALGGADTSKNILGRSIIVHGGTDDYRSQPAGNSGSRIGCGVISRL